MATGSNRFISLDVFRGLTICFMIIVNTPGSGANAFSPLEHAAWFGFTPTDLVFPSFMFAVGNAMSFSMKKFDGLSSSAVVWRVFKRAALIFLAGYLMSWFPFVEHTAAGWSLSPLGHTRILGVLQRIAICYFFASLLIHFVKSTTVIIVISILLLFGYWFILLIWGDPAHPFAMLTNAGTYLDKWAMGDDHLYHGEGVPFDPEGILSNMPAIVNIICGYFAGRFIQRQGKNYEAISKMMLIGALFIFISPVLEYGFSDSQKIMVEPVCFTYCWY